MTNYELLIVLSAGLLNFSICLLVVSAAFCLIRFDGFRLAVAQAIQDADGAFHWVDARNFAFIIAGFLCAWFTMNLGFIFCYARMFDPGPGAFIIFFTTVTFTLWGIAWKKPSIKF